MKNMKKSLRYKRKHGLPSSENKSFFIKLRCGHYAQYMNVDKTTCCYDCLARYEYVDGMWLPI